MTLLARFQPPGGEEQYGMVTDSQVFPLGPNLQDEPSVGETGHALSGVSLLAPALPTKIINVGYNYLGRVEELGMPMPEEPFFTYKPPSTVIGTDQVVMCPPEAAELRYEAELAVVIKRTAKNVPEADAPAYILGYTACNDLNAAAFLKNQPARAAGYDGFFPLGPFVATDLDPITLTIELRVNGELRQRAECGAARFSPAQLVSFLSHIMTLHPGDVISTGTPPHPGLARAGDMVEVTLTGVGTLRNRIVPHR